MGILNLGQESVSPDAPSVGRAKVYQKDDGLFYYMNSDGVETQFGISSDAQIALPRNFYVSVGGNDSTGDGSLGSPFRTIGACIDYINDNYTLSAENNAVILVAAGEYEEDTLIIPPFCSLWGKHYRTRVIAADGNKDLIQMSRAHTVRDLLLSGVTSSSKYHVRIEAIQTTRCTLQNINISLYEAGGSQLSNGVYIASTTGTVTVRMKQIDFNNLDYNMIELGANARLVGKGHHVFPCENATYLKATLNASYSLNDIVIDEAAVGVDHGCTGDSDASSANLRNAVVPLRKFNNGELLVTNVAVKSSNVQITNFENFRGYFYDEIEGEDTVRFLDELSVGMPGGGKESCLGEGDSYAVGVKVYNYDGVTFVDKSDEATSSTGSLFSFPSTGTTREIYVSTQRTFEGSATPLKWYGIKAMIETAASTDGEIIAEYWNGSSWTEFTTLSTASSGTYYPYGNVLFERDQSEQVRFNDAIEDDWATSDPVSLGSGLYWVRFRCTTVPTTLPVFQQIKVHSNRTEINADGYIEFFGKARPIASITLPNFQSANNSPADSDIYFQTNFGVGKKENRFEDGNVDQSSQIIYLPTGVDTSCPISLNAVMFSSGSTNRVDFTIRWVVNREGDSIHNNSGDAPTTNSRVQSKNISVYPPGDDIQFTVKVELDVSEYIAFNADRTPDVLGIQIQRNGNTDDNPSDMTLATAQVFFTRWTMGEHL